MTEKLPLNSILGSLDLRKKDYYDNLNEEQKKQIQPFVLMRYISTNSNPDIHTLSLIATNEIVNVHFWDFSKDKDLQWRLMATCGIGQKSYHKWIANKKHTTKNKLNTFLKDYYKKRNWVLNDTELKIIISNLDQNKLKEMCEDEGLQKNELKDIINEFKK